MESWRNCSTTLWSVQPLGGSKEVPAGIRVLCMDMALLHGLAADHPEVIAYSAEEGCWHAIMSPFHQGWFGCLYSNLVEQGMGGQTSPVVRNCGEIQLFFVDWCSWQMAVSPRVFESRMQSNEDNE